jgi:hypothetical protein
MSAEQNTTTQGNSFRDQVKSLIELTPGCSKVTVECLIGTQAVDVYYEESTSCGTLRVACECKDYAVSLTKDLVARHIYPRYQPLLAKRLVDAVLIVASQELGAVAREYVEECGFAFRTLRQLQTRLLDFRQYLTSLRSVFTEKGLDRYYIRPMTTEGADLEDYIESWIASPANQPIAILGGYGMGKTSFARRLAHVLAVRALEHATCRIPILIPLSEISNEQTLEGLLGKLLAAQNIVPGYHFKLFMELNRLGRFVIILDGFDEMKHTISWAEFKHNFTELNRLNVAGGKLLLLGRPSALLSDAEESFVIHGRNRLFKYHQHLPGMTSYRQLPLHEFSGIQLMEFIRRYAGFLAEADARLRYSDTEKDDIDARIKSIHNDPEMIDLASRPVQAKMLVELSIEPGVQWRSFTRYDLYKEFITGLTDREVTKDTRARFRAEVRLRFIRDVAWWTWRRAGNLGFNVADLPASIFESLHIETEATPIDIQRDLIAGSILEKKIGGTYYFPHRSFLEFLVAEYMCIEGTARGQLVEFSAALTADVAAFIKESGHSRVVAGWGNMMNDVEAPLSRDLLALIAWGRSKITWLIGSRQFAAETDSPRDLLTNYYLLMEMNTEVWEIVKYFRHAFTVVESVQSKITAVLCLMLAQKGGSSELRGQVYRQIVAFMLLQSLDEIHQLIRQPGPGIVLPDKPGPFLRMLLSSVQPVSQEIKSRMFFTVGVISLYKVLQSLLSPLWRVRVPLIDMAARVDPFALEELSNFDPRLALSRQGADVAALFQRVPDPSEVYKPPAHEEVD